MVAPAAFPIAKLGFLLIKQVAKPVAKSIAASAKQSKIFRDYVCIPVAQLFHFYDVKFKMRALNLGAGKVTKVPKLSEAKAVEQGAELLSEAIILSLASTILIYEYNKSKDKEDAKEDKLKADRESIKNKIFELELKVEKQSTQIRSLAKTAIHLEEEVQKRSLKGFLRGPNVPQELIQTVKDIPEVPNEVKPLELNQDKEHVEEEKQGEISQKETKNESIHKPKVKTPIQELVEKHYAKPILIEHKENVSDKISEPSPSEGIEIELPSADATKLKPCTEEVKISEASPTEDKISEPSSTIDTVETVEAVQQSNTLPPKQGVVSGSLSYVLEQQERVKNDLSTPTNNQSEGFVREGLSHFFRQ